MPARFLSLRTSLLALVAIVAIYFDYKYFFAAPPPVNYITAPVETRDIEQTVLADGTIEALKQVSVGAQVSGQIKALHIALGDKVSKGQLLAEIDDLTQQNTLKDSDAALKNIQAQRAAKQATLRNNQLSWQRQQMLMQRGVGAQADYDSAKATLDATTADIAALDAQIAQAEIATSTAKVNLGYTQITAPMDGTIVAIPVEAGQAVNAAQNTPTIAKVANLNTMTVKAQISEADVVNVKVGMPVWFTILGQPNKRYQATLRAIKPTPDSINDETTSSSSSSSSSTSKAIYYNGLFDVDNQDGTLRISMTAQVYILRAAVKNALVVPATAVQQLNGKTVVQVVNAQGQRESRDVTIGINDNVHTQLLTGVSAGEQVIISQQPGSSSSTARHPGPPPM
ncbi:MULTISPECIES: efflux RND transporter periplasmic adaptor subunit [Symbiopectobacterium]|uniref:efflux RND transporter periplasmic adaptor subunit n=1 Tax=Symbiopectobacterium TaxID=801 RepID=UPI001A1FA721|nr:MULTISPECIES: efflux RND transporter periplasmic adaptor subunit [Symbiopectobacterium]MBG6247098.1 efflux RND transporter periplasmic adaptor subunit [Candidatus Symbiopectobacterium sp. PLON1]MBT9429138.1 efflux RND transporter periplasmic adaptor subunit [Candidatus Symbiopectobacterium endolongispinus]